MIHPVIQMVEKFLDTYIELLPKTFQSEEGIFLQTHRKFWRALLLTYGDRYGTASTEWLVQSYSSGCTWGPQMMRIIKKVQAEHKKLRHCLSLRMDTERIQIQRPLSGRSLLSITTSRSSEMSRALRSLVVLGVHPILGVDGYRVKTYNSVPFTLPKKLQDRLPNLTKAQEYIDVEVNATKMTDFVHKIYTARDYIQNIHHVVPEHLQPFVNFIKDTGLHEDTAWNAMGLSSTRFDPDRHGFIIKVPYVIPGKQLILWSTWHATAGASSDLGSAKVTAFIDLVPASFFLEPAVLLWYKYTCQYAPSDPGSGSGRGSYLSFVNRAIEDTQSSEPLSYGLPDEYMEMFDSGVRHMASDSADLRGSGTLTHTQREQFYTHGYLIIDIPEHLTMMLPASKSLQNLSVFFRRVSRDKTFDIQDSDGSSLHRVLELKVAEQLVGKYAYFSDRIPETDPLNPFANGLKSHNPQSGGKLIAKDCGMGKGTTFVNEPFHVAFQYSQFVYNVMSSFYKTGPLIVVLERFRAKTTSSWSNGTHIDTSAGKLITPGYHLYRATHGLYAL